MIDRRFRGLFCVLRGDPTEGRLVESYSESLLDVLPPLNELHGRVGGSSRSDRQDLSFYHSFYSSEPLSRTLFHIVLSSAEITARVLKVVQQSTSSV